MTQSTKDHPAILEERAAYEATIARLTTELAEARAALEDRKNLNRRIKAQRQEIKWLLAWSNQVQKTFYDVIDKKRKLETERDALIGAAYEAAAEKFSGDDNLSRRICCDGHHCGCQAATAADYVTYQLRALIPATATAALAARIAEARKAGMLEAAGIARSIGSPVGAGDGYGTRAVGTSMDASDAILAAAEKGPST